MMRRVLVAVVLGVGSAGIAAGADALLEHKLTTVALQFGAKGPTRDVQQLARAFDGPRGDGRSGARGVVIQGGQLWSRLGTRWRFGWMRGGSAWGVQIIHPLKDGQVVIHVKKSGIGVSTPRAWTEVGYGRGDAKALTRTDAYDKLFPLEDDRLYWIDSALRPDGSYQLSIGDEVVATGTLGAAHPISFAIAPGQRFPLASGWGELKFEGKEFPEQWEAGCAGILLEPLDNGRNQAVGLSFAPDLARLKTDPNTDF